MDKDTTMSEAQMFGAMARNVCETLDLDAALVRSILLEPLSLTVTAYETNEQGHKFIDASGNVALRTITRPLEWPP